MFLVRTVEPIGTSCDVKVSWDSANPRIRLSVPLASFDSQEPDRDTEVLKILKASEHPNLEIESDMIATSTLKEFAEGKDVELRAKVILAGRTTELPFVVRSKSERKVAIVSARTTFTAIGIEPPTVGGGAVAKVRDELELHGQIVLPEEVFK